MSDVKEVNWSARVPETKVTNKSCTPPWNHSGAPTNQQKTSDPGIPTNLQTSDPGIPTNKPTSDPGIPTNQPRQQEHQPTNLKHRNTNQPTNLKSRNTNQPTNLGHRNTNQPNSATEITSAAQSAVKCGKLQSGSG
ncbi:hypothetical protein Pcinc_025493 [Petrolisthes cinctipes]|uniref:Uncharacterized protein n=1 Tax=Petrolisthes cinctipes TaxID=88211 RepID=A0AAE1F7R5_PETCI|nr:hypothetical protein Pcinc_025493 [Petrolisthes cinctipes]